MEKRALKTMGMLGILLTFGLMMGCLTKEKEVQMGDFITIKGKVTDFDGNPIGNSRVELLYNDFSVAHLTYSDKMGNYVLENIEKGKYLAMFVIREDDYPRANAVPEEDMRLEFWAWNIIADRDIIINPRYQKLELYGTTVFRELGGINSYFVYFRPMSVTKLVSNPKDVYLDKENTENKDIDISVKPEHLKVNVFADDEPLHIFSVTLIKYGIMEGVVGYIVHTDFPKVKTDKPYIVFRVEAENTEHNEKGENIYFYEKSDFKSKTAP